MNETLLNKNKINTIITSTIIISSIIVSLTCLILNIRYNYNMLNIWIIPIIYTMLFTLFKNNNPYLSNLSLIIINSVMYIRYIITIIAYYSEYTETNSINYYYIQKSTILIIYEMIIVFLAIKFSIKKLEARNIKLQERSDKSILMKRSSGLIIFLFFGVGIIVTIMYPQLLNNFLGLLIGSRGYILIDSSISGMYMIIYNTFLTIAALLLLLWIKIFNNASQSIFKIILSIIVCTILISSVGIGVTGHIDRWSILVNAIILLLIVIKFYPKYAKLILAIVIPSLVIIIIWTTFIKFFDTQSINIPYALQCIKKIFNYDSLNAYFSGINNVITAIKTNETFGKEIGFATLISDIFGSFPLINKYIANPENSSVFYFNYTLYGHLLAQDQIVPLIGQGYYYLGLILSPLFSGILVWISMNFNEMQKKSHNIVYFYIYSLASIWSALFMCLNINIIFSWFWIKILPIYLIAIFNDLISLSNKKIKF